MENPFVIKDINIEIPRECGGCTACCKTHPILELEKPARKWCSFCRVGRGCRLYGNHPQGCKDFQCQWLFGMHNKIDRPDKTNIVTDVLELPLIGSVISFFEVNNGALENDFTKINTSLFLKEGHPVCHLPLKGNNKLFLLENISLPSGYSLRINNINTDIFSVKFP